MDFNKIEPQTVYPYRLDLITKKPRMRVTLFGDNVLIKPDEKEKTTSGGIVIPDSVNQNENKKGTVIKHGEGSYDNLTGNFNPIKVKEGDRVIYSATAHIQQSPEWENLLLMSEKDILTIIPKL